MKYITDDGMTFDTPEEAAAHEEHLAAFAGTEALIDKYLFAEEGPDTGRKRMMHRKIILAWEAWKAAQQ